MRKLVANAFSFRFRCRRQAVWWKVLAFSFVAAFAGCNRSDQYPSRPITLICPWAAGGGTDRVSRQMAMLLENELGQPVSVINATGGKGVTGHSRGLEAKPDGYTLLMMTFELNTMHWTGLTNLTYKDCVPLISLNEDYAALMVRSDASWQSVKELEAAIAESPKQLTASGTAVGGAWHLALAGWLASAGMAADDVTWVPSQGANPSLQQLVSGGVDMVCCSLPEARTLLEGGQARALGVMAPQRAKGFEEIKTFEEQGSSWTLGGWRGLAVPKGTPPEIVQRLTTAIEKIVTAAPTEGTFAEFMDTQKFDRTWRSPEDFRAFLASTDEKLGALLTSDEMRSLSEDRFSPMAYPWALIGLIAATLIGLAVGSKARSKSIAESPIAESSSAGSSIDAAGPGTTGADGGLSEIAWIIAAIVAYAFLAETVGFLIVGGAIVFLLLMRLRTSPGASVLISITVVPALYFAFAYGLRVPLPRGWFG